MCLPSNVFCTSHCTSYLRTSITSVPPYLPTSVPPNLRTSLPPYLRTSYLIPLTSVPPTSLLPTSVPLVLYLLPPYLLPLYLLPPYLRTSVPLLPPYLRTSYLLPLTSVPPKILPPNLLTSVPLYLLPPYLRTSIPPTSYLIPLTSDLRTSGSKPINRAISRC